MGKLNQSQHQLEEQAIQQEGSSSQESCCWSGVLRRVWTLFSFKCFFILIVSIALFFSTIYWLPPFNRIRFGYDASVADKLNVTVEASFRLQKPVSLLVEHIGALEEDIFGEIGMPSTKITVLSIHQLGTSNWSEVVFSVLPHPKNVPINFVSLSVLRSSFIELFLRQLNLILTTPMFGQPSDFQILKFSGGITVIPIQSISIWQIPQILFNFKLNNSISQIQDCFDQLKDQLKFGLQLRSYEHVYIRLTNRNGSTVDPPLTVQASVFSDIGSRDLLPQRLKQLAQTITGSPPAKNLGLDHSVFGKVKEISLSTLLNRTLHGSPTPSPSPSPSPSSSPSPTLPPSPSEENYYSAPSMSPDSIPSPYDPPSDSPVPAIGSQAPLPPFSEAPAPSAVTTHAPRQSPCRGSAVSPSPAPVPTSDPSAPEFSPSASTPYPPLDPTRSPDFAPSPTVHRGTSPGKDKRSRKASVSPLVASSTRLSSPSGSPFTTTRLIGLLWPLMFYLLCGAF